MQREVLKWSAVAVPESVPRLRTEVVAAAADSGVLDPPLASLRLSVSEALANAVMHGYQGLDEPGSIEVTLEVDLDELRVIVADNGIGMQPRTDSPGAGLGLPIISAVSDGFSVSGREPHGTELLIRFHRVRGPDRDALLV